MRVLRCLSLLCIVFWSLARYRLAKKHDILHLVMAAALCHFASHVSEAGMSSAFLSVFCGSGSCRYGKE